MQRYAAERIIKERVCESKPLDRVKKSSKINRHQFSSSNSFAKKLYHTMTRLTLGWTVAYCMGAASAPADSAPWWYRQGLPRREPLSEGSAAPAAPAAAPASSVPVRPK
jgi:hypothetical protein